MSYKRRAGDRQRALKAKYGDGTGASAPRSFHRHTEQRGGPQENKKAAEKRGHRKHKGEY